MESINGEQPEAFNRNVLMFFGVNVRDKRNLLAYEVAEKLPFTVRAPQGEGSEAETVGVLRSAEPVRSANLFSGAC